MLIIHEQWIFFLTTILAKMWTIFEVSKVHVCPLGSQKVCNSQIIHNHYKKKPLNLKRWAHKHLTPLIRKPLKYVCSNLMIKINDLLLTLFSLGATQGHGTFLRWNTCETLVCHWPHKSWWIRVKKCKNWIINGGILCFI